MNMTTKQIPFEVGQKFYYTGDMANNYDSGEIIEVHQPTHYTQLRYNCKFESGKTRIVEHVSFNKSIGQRFKTIEQYNEEMAERQAAMKKYYSNV